MSIPIFEREKDGEQERRNYEVKQYKSFVENNRRLGTGSECIHKRSVGRRTTKDERERMEGWRDKVRYRVKDKVEKGNVTVSDRQRQNRERKLLAAVNRYFSLFVQDRKKRG